MPGTTLGGANIEADGGLGSGWKGGVQVLGSSCWLMSGADEVCRADARGISPLDVRAASENQKVIRGASTRSGGQKEQRLP